VSTLPEDLVEPLPEETDGALAPAPGPEENEERHRRAVPPRRRAGPRRPALWIGSIVSAASLFLLVAFNVMMVQGQFTLDRVANQRDIEQNKYEHLRAEVAAWSAPDAIVSEAIKLGYVNGPGPIYISAPAAAPPPSSVDQTATTQKATATNAKKSLGASP
jgi:hypothetical protein